MGGDFLNKRETLILDEVADVLKGFIVDTEVGGTVGGAWFGYQPQYLSHLAELGDTYVITDGSLYQGTAGVSLALLHWYAIEPTDWLAGLIGRATRHSLQMLSTQKDVSPGLFSGLAGGIISLYSAKYTGGVDELSELRDFYQERFLDELSSLAEIGEEFGFDLIDGLSGILCAVRLARREGLLELPDDLEENLTAEILTAVVESNRGFTWDRIGIEHPGLCSAAHGNAGIGAVLAMTDEERSTRVGETSIDRVVEGAILYENSWLSPAHRFWPDLRGRLKDTAETATPPPPEHLWCHGGPGIGLSRRSCWSRTSADTELIERDLALARASTLEGLARMYEMPGKPLSLCHGITGLMLVARELGIPTEQWLGRGTSLLVEAIDYGSLGFLRDDFSGLESVGLMTGLAGVLLGALALAHPDQVEELPNPLAPWTWGLSSRGETGPS